MTVTFSPLSAYDVIASDYITETTSNMTSTKDYTGQRTASLVLSTMMLIGGTYLLITLSYYEYQVALKNHKTAKKKFSHKKHSIIKESFNDWSRNLCLLSAIFAFTRFVIQMVEIFESDTSSNPCNWVRHVKAVLQCGAITCIYLVLWLRQRQFYRMPALEYLSSRTIRFFSSAVVVIMVIANILTILLYVASRGYTSSERGCVVLWSTISTKLPGLFFFIFTTSFQIILVGLLIYPLYKHGTTSSLRGSKRQIQLIKRVSIAAVVAVLTTALASLLSITVLSGNYGALRQVVFDIDILVSLLSIIFSFKDWKARVMPCLANNETVIGSAKRTSDSHNSECSNTNIQEASPDHSPA